MVPAHTLPTTYRYNSLNQVVSQQSPDGGLSRLRCWGELPAAERERMDRRFEESLPSGHRVFPVQSAAPLVSPALGLGPA